MNVIVTVDDAYGMMFHHRRLSRDRVLNQKILDICQHTILRMSSYSASLFPDLPDYVSVSDDFLEEADNGDICFVEDRALLPYADKIDTMYLFFWNRHYPSDFKLDYIPSEHSMTLQYTKDFKGHSHPDIRLEIWQKAL
ncbi:MAG: hypothetical protein PUA69_03400 [Erysipelotrichaceae bacterium]|jgi:hypothetical protein|nr:hypothetical protein [Erysipelotrichaceae bacterium]